MMDIPLPLRLSFKISMSPLVKAGVMYDKLSYPRGGATLDLGGSPLTGGDFGKAILLELRTFPYFQPWTLVIHH